MPDPNSNHAESTFHSMSDLADAIIAARTFGMRDVTVTTVYRPSSRDARGEYVGETVKYHLQCSMLGEGAEEQRQLAHVGDVRAALERASDDAVVRRFERESVG